MKKAIPVHDFNEEDTKNVPVRYIQLNPLTEYDIAPPHRHNYYEVFFLPKVVVAIISILCSTPLPITAYTLCTPVRYMC
ncbi:MAG: hypothetical protein M0D57_06895 [Sphingobacteriales bacterium JAD_PAG50586_3]|nr:MAG: hypothetical protein M0D57_06895 [Sphingobacteriales bacterium JAD_PAG50586_3]